MGYLDCSVNELGCIIGPLKKGDQHGQLCVRKLILPGADRGWRERAQSREPAGSPGEGWGDLTKAGREDEFQSCGQDRELRKGRTENCFGHHYTPAHVF